MFSGLASEVSQLTGQVGDQELYILTDPPLPPRDSQKQASSDNTCSTGQTIHWWSGFLMSDHGRPSYTRSLPIVTHSSPPPPVGCGEASTHFKTDTVAQ